MNRSGRGKSDRAERAEGGRQEGSQGRGKYGSRPTDRSLSFQHKVPSSLYVQILNVAFSLRVSLWEQDRTFLVNKLILSKSTPTTKIDVAHKHYLEWT